MKLFAHYKWCTHDEHGRFAAHTCLLSFLEASADADLVLSSKSRKLFLFKEPLALSLRLSEVPASDNLSPSMFCCCRTALNSCTTPLQGNNQLTSIINPCKTANNQMTFSSGFSLPDIQINFSNVCVCVCVCMCACTHAYVHAYCVCVISLSVYMHVHACVKERVEQRQIEQWFTILSI